MSVNKPYAGRPLFLSLNIDPKNFDETRSRFQQAEYAANWCLNEIEPENWTPSQYRENFGLRTPGEILTSRKTGFAGACLDRTLVGNTLLQNAGFETTLVVEELKERNAPGTKLHFAIEFEMDKEPWHIDFLSTFEAHLAKGRYKGIKKEGEESLVIQRFPGQQVGLDNQPFTALYGITTPQQLGEVMPHFSAADLEQSIEQIRIDSDKIGSAYAKYLELKKTGAAPRLKITR